MSNEFKISTEGMSVKDQTSAINGAFSSLSGIFNGMSKNLDVSFNLKQGAAKNLHEAQKLAAKLKMQEAIASLAI